MKNNTNHTKYTETKTQRYNDLKRFKQMEMNMLEFHEKDIKKLKEELERKEKCYEDTKKKITKYNNEITELLNK